jgi:hypothetical protein
VKKAFIQSEEGIYTKRRRHLYKVKKAFRFIEEDIELRPSGADIELRPSRADIELRPSGADIKLRPSGADIELRPSGAVMS